ncbi:MAG: hypothetical protein AAGA75_07960 [Cyanobacteria bacterium P01_E01_bin.6]
MDKQVRRVTLPKFETSSSTDHAFSFGQVPLPIEHHLDSVDGDEDSGDVLPPPSLRLDPVDQEFEIGEAQEQEPTELQGQESTERQGQESTLDVSDTHHIAAFVEAVEDDGAVPVSHVLHPEIDVPTADNSTPRPDRDMGAIAPRRLRKKRRSRRFSVLWTITGTIGLILFSGLGVIAYRWLTWLPPDPDCRELPLLASDSDRLYCAQQAAQDGAIDNILAGIDLTKDWHLGHPMYQKSQEALTEWSAAVLEHADMALRDDGLEPAVALVSRIPPNSSLYEDAQGLMTLWQQQWDNGETIYQQALDAIDQQDWSRAAEQVTALGQVPQSYWREERSHELSLKVLNEREAHDQLNEAAELAESGRPDDLVAAMSLIHTIPTESSAWQAAQPFIQQWGPTLVDQGLEALSVGNLDKALEHVQHVPLDLVEDGEAQNLLLFSHAKKLTAFESVPWVVNSTEVLHLAEAIDSVQRISDNSQLYGVAQESTVQWQIELDNVRQLQLAQWIAQIGSRPALELAMHQAATVGIDDPRRLQAQTLIAYWNQEVQNIQHRPQLAIAQRIAESGTTDALNAAIAYVSSVGVDPAQWTDAEQWIGQWTQQLQAIEDRPILIEARKLASEGNWKDAIARAQDIGIERSLYAIAQDSIEEWQGEFQLEQDTANLAQARAFAAQVRLTQAIHRASLVQPGQPLYEEAQSLISQWVAQRTRIQASRPASRPSEQSTTPSSSSNTRSQQNSYEGYYDSRYYDYHRQ